MTAHETGFKTRFGIIQHSFKTCFGIIQHQLDEEKKVYKLEVISTVCLTYTNVWESMGKPCSGVQFIKKPYWLYYKSRENLYQYYKSRENPYQVLQVARCV